MTISVLMPAYNAEKYLKEAIESILSQTYPLWELLICDDASTDSTYRLADSYKDSRIRVFQNETNRGKPTTVNNLFKESTGELITIHDADDISLPERFQIMAKKFEDPKVFVCGHVIERVSEGGRPLGLYREKKKDHSEIQRLMRWDNTDGDASLIFRREVVDFLNGELLRPYFPNNMDYDMALRMMEKYPFTNVLEVLFYYRNVPNSISKGLTSYKKLVTKHMTKFFHQQRIEKGSDALMSEDWDLISKKEKEFSKPYIEDKTLYLREMASFYMYIKMEKYAILNMLRAVRVEPLKFNNWRTLQYCIRKSLMRSVN